MEKAQGHKAHYPILSQFGINETEALLYELLLEMGPRPAQDLVAASALGRGNVYNALTSLKKKGLVLERSGKKAVFEAAQPNLLSRLLKVEQDRVSQLAKSLEAVLPMLASEYALSTGRPMIEVFEGMEGAEQAVFDSLKTRTDILTYYDFESLQGPFESLDERYYKKYVAMGKHKRVIVADTPKAHGFFSEPLEQTRVAFVPGFPERAQGAILIYDDTVTFVTIKGDRLISVILRDRVFSEMMRQQFEFQWKLAKTVLEPPQAASGIPVSA